MKHLYSLALILAFSTAWAQPYGHLTLFSEDGDKFTLVLNGETINDVPQANLRVEELTQPYYNARIIFEDATKNELSKTIQITDVDNVYKDVTYKIRRDKNNAKKMKLSYFSDTEVRPDFIPPSNVKVIHYGHPAQTVTQTTTTTTSSQGATAGMSIQGAGVGISVSVNDPMLTGTLTQTTTTTTTTSGGTFEEEPAGCFSNRCMGTSDFSAALSSLKKQSFEDTRLKMAKQIAEANCLSTDQIKQVCSSFSFEDNKLDFAKFAYVHCTDPKSYFKINDVFSFSSSSEELSDFVSSAR